MAGETTSASSTKGVRKLAGPGLTTYTWALAYATGQLEANDVMEAGYLPEGVTVVGFIVKSTDMDTHATPTLVQKITLGSTDLVTGIADGKTGAGAFYACVPTAITTKTLVKVTNTAAAATAAAGTLYLTPVFYTT